MAARPPGTGTWRRCRAPSAASPRRRCSSESWSGRNTGSGLVSAPPSAARALAAAFAALRGPRGLPTGGARPGGSTCGGRSSGGCGGRGNCLSALACTSRRRSSRSWIRLRSLSPRASALENEPSLPPHPRTPCAVRSGFARAASSARRSQPRRVSVCSTCKAPLLTLSAIDANTGSSRCTRCSASLADASNARAGAKASRRRCSLSRLCPPPWPDPGLTLSTTRAATRCRRC